MTDFEDVSEEIIQHYGILGMRWGVRRSENELARLRGEKLEGVSRRVSKEARKDARDSAAAKQFYGEGAGTRRKLIRETVEAKRTRIPGYGKAFDYHSRNQDLSVHSDRAVRERKSLDRRKSVRQTSGAVARRLTGEMGTKAALVALVSSGYAYSRTPQGQRAYQQTMNRVKHLIQQNTPAARRAQQFIRDAGLNF